ncbi:diacylglycerol kinase family protein [Bacillus sp. FJAT-27251]|uniref:diacylglycerol kinase family protein n=1 Tax=Bacillus sp. FJAT-27251 TaxID=1684142 RepID=UPI0006A7C21C|nr:diacylglycerol kinase family protein [Bacillus sp. FJAT-27251]
MNMGSSGRNGTGKPRLIRSFAYAFAGIRAGLKQERNLQIHLVISMAVILLGFFWRISAVEWLFICLSIGGMLASELMNSAIEKAVDLVTTEYHPLAKQAKDMAAGAVLLFAITSVIIGLVIFGPKLLPFLL